MRKLLFLLLAASVSQKTLAQLTDTARIQYRLALTGNIAKGNIDRVIVNSELMAALVNRRWGASSRNTYFYFANRGLKADADFLSRNFVYLAPKNKIYPYAMYWREGNFRRKIDSRYQIGVGGSYVFLQKAAHRMKASLSLTHEATTFVGNKFEGNTDTTASRIRANRATVRLIGFHAFKTNTLKVSYEFWNQLALSGGLEPRFYGEVNLDLPLVKHFNFRTTFLYAYENRVYEKVKQQDFTVLLGVTYAYK
jgi:glucose-6-phosphate isomerase